MRKFLMRAGALAALLIAGISPVGAATTPIAQAIPDARATRIACDFAATQVSALGETLQLPAAEYHYLVWLPPGYRANAKREYPCLFIASPFGNATPQLFVDRLTRDSWIAIALVESKNGNWEPILANFLAAHDDAVKRLRIANHFKFMTGLSGGARASAACSGLRPGFAGVLLQGAGFANKDGGAFDLTTLQANPGLGVYGIFGIQDPNRPEAAVMQMVFPPATPRRFALNEGGHQWATPAAIDEGMDFLQECAYVRRAPPEEAARGQYVQRFQLLVARGRAANGFAAYQAFEEADRIAGARKFADDPAVAADAGEAAAQVAKLAQMPVVAKELKAREAYLKIRTQEDAQWLAVAGPSPNPPLTVFAKQTAQAYEGLRKEFGDTIYGRRAIARAAWLARTPQQSP